MSGQRLQYDTIAPQGVAALSNVEKYIRTSGLEPSLIELVKMRASQINGCAFCLAMHSRDARRHGESEQRLYLLDAWDESSLYTPRERAALAWTDALTRLPDTHAPDDVYDGLRPHFSDKEAVDLTILIGMINLWNRIAVGFRMTHAVDSPKAG